MYKISVIQCYILNRLIYSYTHHIGAALAIGLLMVGQSDSLLGKLLPTRTI